MIFYIQSVQQIGSQQYWPIDMIIQEILHRLPERKLNQQRRVRLSCLIELIPRERKNIQAINSFIQHAMNIDYTNIAIFVKKGHVQTYLNALKADIARGQLNLLENAEPFERFLVRAIAKGKSWNEIIHQHQLNLLFPKHRGKWEVREVWFILLCFIGFSEQLGQVLVYRLLNRHKGMAQRIYSKALSFSYFEKKLQIWLSKSQSQLQDIYDDDERNLLKAITSKTTYMEALKMKCFSTPKFEKKKQIKCLSLWICFLCHQFKDNIQKEYLDIHYSRQTFVWSTLNIKQINKIEIRQEHQFRIKDILNKYESFQKHFTDEVEVVLLTAIKKELSWPQTKKLINDLFESNKDLGKEQIKRHNEDNLSHEKKQDDSEDAYTLQNRKFNSVKRRKQYREDRLSKLKLQNKKIENYEDEDEQNQLYLIEKNIQRSKIINKKPADEATDFNLSAQQKLVLSLLERAKQNINKFQISYTLTQPESQPQISPYDLKSDDFSIADNILQIHQQPHKIDQINNYHVQCLVRTIQPFASFKETSHLNIEKQQEEDKNLSKHELSESFIDGYNKIVEKLGLPIHLIVNRGINLLEDRSKEE